MVNPTARRQRLLCTLTLGACALLALAEAGLIFERWHSSRSALAHLEEMRAQARRLAHHTPSLTPDTAQKITADLARAHHAIEAMQEDLRGGASAARLREARPPANRTDAFFELATFVERMRESAKKHAVEIAPAAARFGFSAYANEAPELERIPAVFRQRLILEQVVTAIFEARPRALLAVRREAPLTSGAPAMPGSTPDLFTLDPRRSLRAPGHIDTLGFQFVFVGETAALRTLLNRFAHSDLPISVRDVEVTPAAASEIPAARDETGPAAETEMAASVVLTLDSPATPSLARKKTASRASAPAPILPKVWSKFTVTLEYLELPPRSTVSPPRS